MGEKGIRIRDLNHLREMLLNCPLNIRGAFLFGSRARGDFMEESDWDILIISPDFAGIPFPERATFALRKIPLRKAELLCCTEEEVSQKAEELGIISEALKGDRLI